MKRSRLATTLLPASQPPPIVINGVTYVPTEDVTSLNPTPAGGNLSSVAGAYTTSVCISDSDEIEFITPPRNNRSPTAPSENDIFDAFDMDLPNDLDSIPALSPSLSHLGATSNVVPFSFQSRPALPYSPRSERPPSPTKPAAPPTTPIQKDLCKIARLPASSSADQNPAARGSPARLAAIQKALASVATQGTSPARTNFSTRPVPDNASPTAASPAPQRRSLLSQIDSIVLAPATSSVPSPPSALFDDGGLSDEGCLRLDLFDAFLAPTYVGVLNLK